MQGIQIKTAVHCVLFVVYCFLFSCDSSRIFEDNREIPDNAWAQHNKVVFEVELADTATRYNLYLNVRNAGHYPFRNIFLFVTTTLPDGTPARDTAECMLADAEGKWLGSGLGDIWDNRILFRKDMRFPQAGKYRFELEQAMRMDPLHGIMDVGIRIEKNSE